MNGMNYVFDATQFDPRQIGGSHPVGRFPANISNTEIKPTKDEKSGMFVVEFTSAAGSISLRYNLWNESAKAVEIAQGQLSALCHAVGIYKVDMNNAGAALRGASLMIEVGFQKGEEPSQDKPNGGYTEVKKVLTKEGNEPGKANSAPANQQTNNTGFGQQQNNTANANQAPMTNNGSGWNNNQQSNPSNGFSQNTAQQGQGGAWQGPGSGQVQQEQQPQNNAQGGNSGGWSQQGGGQGGGNNSVPPWGGR